MKVFFDSSVLIAAMIEDEPAHASCAAALEGADDGYACSHSLAECFSILTGGRSSVRLTPDQAAEVIRRDVIDRLTLVPLEPADYATVLDGAQGKGVRGGGIYDALLLQAARKCQAERILTLNLSNFRAFGPDLASIIGPP